MHLFGQFLARDVFALLPRCSPVCLSGTDMHYDRTVHFSADLS